MEIIGLSGYARSGKDETAKILVKEFGFKRVAFADKLRDFLYALNPDVWSFSYGFGRTYEPLRTVIDKETWEGVKKYQYKDSVRQLLQRLGTEAGREVLGENVWVDAALTGYDDNAKLVVTDCRFVNEAEAVTSRGGVMWRIMRQGVGPANSHASETSLDDWNFDAYVHNDGTLKDLAASVKRRYLERLGTKV